MQAETIALNDQRWDQLLVAHARYTAQVSTHYDEVLRDVAAAIEETGSIGKADIGALLFWKRLRANTPWVGKLHAVAEVDVRRVTARAVQAVRDPDLSLSAAASIGREALAALPGFRSGDALASALLTAAAPSRMAIYDVRAHAGLTRLGLTLPPRRRYGTYLGHLDDLLRGAPEEANDWLPRDVDLALYMLGPLARQPRDSKEGPPMPAPPTSRAAPGGQRNGG